MTFYFVGMAVGGLVGIGVSVLIAFALAGFGVELGATAAAIVGGAVTAVLLNVGALIGDRADDRRSLR